MFNFISYFLIFLGLLVSFAIQRLNYVVINKIHFHGSNKTPRPPPGIHLCHVEIEMLFLFYFADSP